MRTKGRISVLLDSSVFIGRRGDCFGELVERLQMASRVRTLLEDVAGCPVSFEAVVLLDVDLDRETYNGIGEELSGTLEQEAGIRLDRIDCLCHPTHATYSPLAWSASLARRDREQPMDGPEWLLLSDDYQNAELIGMLAAKRGCAALTGVDSFAAAGDGTIALARREYQGKLVGRYEVPAASDVVLTVRPDAEVAGQGGDVESASAASATEVVVTCFLEDPAPRNDRQVRSIQGPDASGIDLGRAERLVSAGRGVGSAEGIAPLRELARRLDATLSASRPVVDAGWLERERQVGSSGQVVAPELYLAVGISGSVQHLQGMQRSKCIVAINDDPEAPIWSVAHYGIVGDLHTVVPEWIRLLEARGEAGD